MNDAFIKGLKRALAKKKASNDATVKPVRKIQAESPVKVVTGFDEKLYQATIINKMIQLIRKHKEQVND